MCDHSIDAQLVLTIRAARWDTRASQTINRSIMADTVVIRDPTLATVFQYRYESG